MEHDAAKTGGQRADPEAQAGQALRRLRLARNWTQEEVAMRMTAYGYDFHQTTIAKIEAAQRPLRVRELADFAALYGVGVQDLVYPPSRSLPEIDQEIREVTVRLETAQEAVVRASDELMNARQAMDAAQALYRVSEAEVAVLQGRLASLSADREKVNSWEAERYSFLAEGTDKAERNPFEPSAASITSIAEGGPTVLRLVLGGHLRRLREASNITTEEAAKVIRASRSKISRLEMGRVGFKDREITDLLRLYGVTDEIERHQFRELAHKANNPGWWHDYSDILPNWFEAYIGLEMAAAEMWIYEVQSVPELLQTQDYSRAVTPWDHGAMSSKEIDRRIHLRTIRQDKFLGRSNPPSLRVVLDEALIQRQIGGPEVMRDQLKHLVEIAKRPNITVQVLPLETNTDSAEGSFKILQFGDFDLPDIVYVEQLTSALYIDKPQEISVYRRVMERLRARAYSPNHTIMFLQKLIAARDRKDPASVEQLHFSELNHSGAGAR